MKPALILDERAIRVQLLRTAWTGTAVGAVVATAHPAAAPRADGDAIVIRSPPPRPSRYGGWDRPLRSPDALRRAVPAGDNGHPLDPWRRQGRRVVDNRPSPSEYVLTQPVLLRHAPCHR